jgi:hypothetical protein
MEDALGDRDPTPRFRLAIARAGLRERGHEAGVMGNSAPAAERIRAGSLLVLCAWAVFVVAGSSFAKLSEGFGPTVPHRMAPLTSGPYDAVVVVAIAGCIAVFSGMAMAMPAFFRFLKAGGWSSIRGHVSRALIATALASAAVGALVALARTLTPAQRNGELLYHPAVWYYLVAFVVTMLLLALMLALWTVAAVVTVRRLDLQHRVISAEALVAGVVTATMVVMTAATAVWWGAIASSAPWFLQGTKAGSAGSPLTGQLVGTMALMLMASVLALYAVTRLARSWRQLRLSGD